MNKPRITKSVGYKPTQDVVIKNISLLYARDWRQTEPRGKTVYNITQGTNPTLESLELVAERAKVPVWYLLLDMSERDLNDPSLALLVDIFLKLDEKAREYVLTAAKLASK